MPADPGPISKFWRDRSVLVTGGAGFIGSHLVQRLIDLGAKPTVADNLENSWESRIPSSVRFLRSNLLDQKACQVACKDVDTIYNAAAKVAGVGYNSAHPGEMFHKNAQINLNMLEAARMSDAEQYVALSSACVYKRDVTVPTLEEDGFLDDPEPTNFGYGWAKRMAEVQARAYASEYGMKISIIRPYNTYGPWDHFDESGHVIPTLIRKVNSGIDELVVWGSGQQRRSFVYVSDLVEGLALSPEKYPVPDPINIGNEEETQISQLVDMIMSISGKRIPVRYDRTKPEGQLRRRPELGKAKKLLGYTPKVPLAQGLRLTIEWYTRQIKGSEAPTPKIQTR